MASIEKAIEKSLDRVLDAYSKKGIMLSERPKITYEHEINPDTVYIMAMVGIKNRQIDLSSQTVRGIAILQSLDTPSILNLTEDEQRAHFERELAEDCSNRNLGITVNVQAAKIIAECIGDYCLDETLAHEVWHIVEDEHNILLPYHLISEGTATYAGNMLIHGKFDFQKELMRGFEHPSYLNVAYFVGKYANSAPDIFKTILNTNVRDLIQDEYCEFLEEAYTKEVSSKTMDDLNMMKAPMQVDEVEFRKMNEATEKMMQLVEEFLKRNNPEDQN